MANEEQLSILKQGFDVWNRWRQENPKLAIDFIHADLEKIDLSFARLNKADFMGANLKEANLGSADLRGANLRETNLSVADLHYAQLGGANLTKAYLCRANLSGARLSTILRPLLQNNIRPIVDTPRTVLNGANLSGAHLNDAKLQRADFTNANLYRANLANADLSFSVLVDADFTKANLYGANLNHADINGANLTEANLEYSTMIGTNVDNAQISKSRVYGINVWDLKGEFKEQRDVVITKKISYSETGISHPTITVDNIKVAQFIYLILNNEEVREVINALTSKSVLILGRFAIPERKEILDGLRNKLREYDLLPIVFDFDRPTDKDFTETIKTLAGISYFVIADVTNPKSSPLELQATVPDYQIPFVPIIQEGESPFAMMVDLQKKYDWVLDTVSYDSLDTLIEILKPLIIDPAIKMRDKLRIIKAAEPTIISGREWKEKKG